MEERIKKLNEKLKSTGYYRSKKNSSLLRLDVVQSGCGSIASSSHNQTCNESYVSVSANQPYKEGFDNLRKSSQQQDQSFNSYNSKKSKTGSVKEKTKKVEKENRAQALGLAVTITPKGGANDFEQT